MKVLRRPGHLCDSIFYIIIAFRHKAGNMSHWSPPMTTFTHFHSQVYLKRNVEGKISPSKLSLMKIFLRRWLSKCAAAFWHARLSIIFLFLYLFIFFAATHHIFCCRVVDSWWIRWDLNTTFLGGLKTLLTAALTLLSRALDARSPCNAAAPAAPAKENKRSPSCS